MQEYVYLIYKIRLQVKTVTWNKESNELLDYESLDIKKNELEIKTEGGLVKRNEGIKFVSDDLEEICKPLTKLECDSKDFYVTRVSEGSALGSIVNKVESPWIVVKHYKNSEGNFGYKLIEGDVIKLGRVKLKVYSIKLESASHEDSNDNHTKHFGTGGDKSNADLENNNLRNSMGVVLTNMKEDKVELGNSKTNRRSKNLCRICYCDEKEVDSPLIQPCLCSGTMKYIHFCCLQKWLKSKVVVRASTSEFCTTYSLKQIECELCKNLLPDFVKCKDKLYEIWDFKPSYKSYIIFETLITEKNANRVMYVINLESKHSIRIGRGHDSDIRVTDISVSRFHALIKKESDGSFLIEDNNSKFGTLVLMQCPRFVVSHSIPLPLQIGRTFFSFTVKKPFKIFSCVCSSSKKKEKVLDYRAMNAQFINFENCNLIKIQNDDTIDDILGSEVNKELCDNKDINDIKDIKDIKDELFREANGQNKEVFFKILDVAQEEKEQNENIFEAEAIDSDNNYYRADGNERQEVEGNETVSRKLQVHMINSINAKENKKYLERALTNAEWNKKDVSLKMIEEKIKNDLQDLRRVRLRLLKCFIAL